MSRIAEIRARLAAVTPGPWRVAEHAPNDPAWVEVVPNQEDEQGQDVASVFTGLNGGIARVRSGPQQTVNAAFIASAPEDESYLLARLDEAVAILKGVVKCDACDNAWSYRGKHTCEINKATEFLAEIET